MRLTDHEKTAIIEAISPYATAGTALWLLGSRTDDTARGGDIDLLLVQPNESAYENTAEQKVERLIAMKQRIGEQKIDFIITTPKRIASEPFLTIISEKAILLNRW